MSTARPDHVWVVVPFSRPDRLDHVIENVHRQRGIATKLVLVANGAARGVQTSDIITSEPSPGAAKNAGLELVRSKGGGFFAIFDDDDWYGPDYLAELARNAHQATVVGKRRHFVHLSDGLYLFDEAGANKPSEWVTGACTAGWAEDAVPFAETLQCGEDAAWCTAMAAKGATFWATSPWNFIYDHRGPGHAWVASDVTVRRQLGDAWRFCEGVAAPEFVPRPSDAEVFEDMRL